MDVLRDQLRAAREKTALGDLDGAIQFYQEILRQDPNHGLALHDLGILMSRREEFGRAAELLEQALAARPSDPACHVELGEAYRNLGKYRDAAGCCLTAIKLKPGNPEALNTLGLTLKMAGDPRGALERFRQAISCQPGFSPAYVNAGLVLQELGELGKAIEYFREAVGLTPDSYQARANLGLALLEGNFAAESLPHFQAAAVLRPDLAVLHHNQGNALRLLGRPVEARASYLKAIRLDPGLTLSHLHIGMTLRVEGSLGDAVRWYKLAAEMEPDNPRLWRDLAELHEKLDAPYEAIPCRQRVVDLSAPDDDGPRVELGWALQEDGRLDEAMDQYSRAREARPASALAHFALGGAYEEQGDMPEAEAQLREAIRLQPRFPGAYARLATLLRDRSSDEDLRVLESLLSGPGLGAQPRARLLFALAHVLDARREYSGAAACSREANALTVDSRRAEGLGYDPDAHDQLAERLIRVFDRDFFRRVAGMGLGTRRPVFVVGLPRSGTTLVEQILASHPRVHGAGERFFARRSFERVPSVVGMDDSPTACVAMLEDYSLKTLAGEHLARLNALDSGLSSRIVDKLPDNYLYAGLIVAMFPNATLIHCRRDLRDVAVSCWMSDFRGIRWSNDPMHIGSRFRQYRRLMEHWGREFPAPILHVDYEETVSDLEGVARRLLECCGLDWDASCLEFHRTRRIVRTASVAQVRRPIYKSSVARWKNYETALLDLFEALPASGSGPGQWLG